MAVNTDPQWYQNMVAGGTVAPGYGAVPPDESIKFREPEPDGITLRSGEDEMIRCTKEGFWVRGQKVKQDDKEAEVVYNAFKEWLTWAQLNKDYS